MADNRDISPLKITQTAPTIPQASAISLSFFRRSRTRKTAYIPEIDGTSVKITLVLRAVVYLSDRNMHQKKITREPLINPQRPTADQEKQSPVRRPT
jgi:hypothetical protein